MGNTITTQFPYIITLIVIAYMAFASTLLFFMRSIQPIRSRAPGILIAIAPMFILAYLFWMVDIIRNGVHCFNTTLGNIPLFMIILMYLVRGWRLYFLLNISLRKVEEKGKLEWFTSHKWLSEPKFLWSVLVTSFIVFSVVMLILYLIDPNNYPITRNDNYCYTASFLGFLIAISVSSVAAILFAGLAYKLRKISFSDSFNMKKELLATAILAVIMIILYTTLSFSSSFVGYEYINAFGITLIFTVSYTGPTYLAIKENKRRYFYIEMGYSNDGAENEHSAKKFTKLLEDPNALEPFKKFLMGEFSVENIIFYEEVHKFKDTHDRALLIVKAHDIVETYIKEGASSQINISDRIRNMILKKN